MIFITKRDTAIRSMHEARAQGQLDLNDHFNRIGALRELRSIVKLDIKSAIEFIDRVIAGEEMKLDLDKRHSYVYTGSPEWIQFAKIMNDFGFVVVQTSDNEEFTPDDPEYFIAVDDEPVDDLRIEIERRVLLLVRSRNQYNQSWGHPPCNIPNLVNLTDAELLDLYAEMLAMNSVAMG